jgi:dynein heavy chain, axonemal
VKDLGRTLGLFVVVTNCTDQQKYTDCAKIFKGLCQVRCCVCVLCGSDVIGGVDCVVN